MPVTLDTLSEKLNAVEIKLAKVSTQMDGIESWLSKRDEECQELEGKIQTVEISNAKHGVYVTLISVFISALITVSITYIFTHQPMQGRVSSVERK